MVFLICAQTPTLLKRFTCCIVAISGNPYQVINRHTGLLPVIAPLHQNVALHFLPIKPLTGDQSVRFTPFSVMTQWHGWLRAGRMQLVVLRLADSDVREYLDVVLSVL